MPRLKEGGPTTRPAHASGQLSYSTPYVPDAYDLLNLSEFQLLLTNPRPSWRPPGQRQGWCCDAWRVRPASPRLMSGAMEAHLAECVQDALANFLHRNATFLADRLFASFPNEVWSASSSALLPADSAGCAGKRTPARHLPPALQAAAPGVRGVERCGTPCEPRRCAHPLQRRTAGLHAHECRYLLAVACVEMGLLSEAEQALVSGAGDEVRRSLSDGCRRRVSLAATGRFPAAPLASSCWASYAGSLTASSPRWRTSAKRWLWTRSAGARSRSSARSATTQKRPRF